MLRDQQTRDFHLCRHRLLQKTRNNNTQRGLRKAPAAAKCDIQHNFMAVFDRQVVLLNCLFQRFEERLDVVVRPRDVGWVLRRDK